MSHLPSEQPYMGQYPMRVSWYADDSFTWSEYGRVYVHRLKNGANVRIYKERHGRGDWIITLASPKGDGLSSGEHQLGRGYHYLKNAKLAGARTVIEQNINYAEQMKHHRMLYWVCSKGCPNDWGNSHSSCKAGLTKCAICGEVVTDTF